MKNDDFSLAVKATLQIYLECAQKASRSLLKNWEVMVGIVAAGIGLIVAAGFLSGGGMAGGFVIAIMADAMLAYYYGWLSELVQGRRVSWKQLGIFDWSLFIAIIGVNFILYLIWLFSSPVAHDPDTAFIIAVVNLLIAFAFNALPEAIYIHRNESIAAFSLAARFTKENWIEWYLPFVVLLTPLMLITQQPIYFLGQFAVALPLIPSTIFIMGVVIVLPQIPWPVSVLLGLLLAHWYMLFRGFLFIELESGTRRRRIYLARQR